MVLSPSKLVFEEVVALLVAVRLALHSALQHPTPVLPVLALMPQLASPIQVRLCFNPRSTPDPFPLVIYLHLLQPMISVRCMY